jgi:hypothetical protein
MLVTSEKVIGPLVAAEKLTTCVVINPINRCPQVVIMPEEVAKFQRKYVSLWALAKERGKHFRQVLKEIDAQASSRHSSGRRSGRRSMPE